MSLATDAAVRALTIRGSPETTHIASSLWRDCTDKINTALHCPFVRSLADGSLPKYGFACNPSSCRSAEADIVATSLDGSGLYVCTACRHAFQHYVSQDAFFLKAFAQAYALALCQTTDAQERQTLQDLLQGVDKELEMHKAYAKVCLYAAHLISCGMCYTYTFVKDNINLLQTWGVRLTQMHKPGPATQSYVDFLLNTALHQVSLNEHNIYCNCQCTKDGWQKPDLVCDLQSLPCILAAMIPCLRLYAYIGCQLRAAALAAPAVIRAQAPYSSWIKEYSSDAILALPACIEALLDKLAPVVPYGESHPWMLCI